MAAFFDLSLPHLDSVASSSTSSAAVAARRDPPLHVAARALELGYAAVACDRPHRGVLADSDRSRGPAAAFPLSSLPSTSPLASSAALHRRRLAACGGGGAGGFRQYTRVTVAVDSAAAAAAALAPSALVLRTYDLVAARPLGQAAFDHVCKFSEVDIISIDFSQKLPFRLKLPSIEVAIKRGLYFEIAYSPLIGDVNSRRQMLSDAKLLVDWTRGKNLIISSAASTANELRGPYDVANFFVYLLGLSMEQAKAALSTNCRSLITKALRKKNFYKETIRIERLLPDEQLDPTKLLLSDWIGWDPTSNGEGDLPSLEENSKSSAKAICANSCAADVASIFEEKCPLSNSAAVYSCAKQSEQSVVPKETPAISSEETGQLDRDHETLTGCRLSTSQTHFEMPSLASETILVKPGDVDIVAVHSKQADSASSVDLKSSDEHMETDHDAMPIDLSHSQECNYIAGDDALLSSDVDLTCFVVSQNIELRDVCLEDNSSNQSHDITDASEAYKDNTELMECIINESGDQTPSNDVVPLHGDLLENDVQPEQVVEVKTEQEMDDEIDSVNGKKSNISGEAALCGLEDNSVAIVDNKGSTDATKESKEVEHCIETGACPVKTIPKVDGQTASANGKTSANISGKAALCGQEDSSVAMVNNKRSMEATKESKEVGEIYGVETDASLAKTTPQVDGQILSGFPANDGMKSSAIKSGRRRQKPRLRCPSYPLPFRAILRPILFKKVCLVRRPSKQL